MPRSALFFKKKSSIAPSRLLFLAGPWRQLCLVHACSYSVLWEHLKTESRCPYFLLSERDTALIMQQVKAGHSSEASAKSSTLKMAAFKAAAKLSTLKCPKWQASVPSCPSPTCKQQETHLRVGGGDYCSSLSLGREPSQSRKRWVVPSRAACLVSSPEQYNMSVVTYLFLGSQH